MKKLEELLNEVRKDLIEPLKTENVLSEGELKALQAYFAELMKEICEVGKQKLDDKDIYEYPHEVAYLLYCYPIQLVSAIKDKKKIYEYIDFYLEEYPEIKFNGNISEFYEIIRGEE